MQIHICTKFSLLSEINKTKTNPNPNPNPTTGSKNVVVRMIKYVKYDDLSIAHTHLHTTPWFELLNIRFTSAI